MNKQSSIDAETKRLAAQLQEAVKAMLSQPPATPQAVKKVLVEQLMLYMQDHPLTEGSDYRIEVDNTEIVIIPVSERCIAWFQGALAPPLYEVTLNIHK